MKRFLSLTALCIAATLALSSCSSTPDNMIAIPKDTHLVSSIDLFSLALKGSLDDFPQTELYKALKKEFHSENKKAAKTFDNLVEDPFITGIDLMSEAFIYYIKSAENETFIAVSVELGSKEKFEAFLEQTTGEMAVEFSIEREEGFQYAMLSGSQAIGWDEDKAVLLVAQNYSSRELLDFELDYLFSLDERSCIAQNKDFSSFYDDKKDLSLWVSTNLFADAPSVNVMKMYNDVDFSDSYIHAYLDFQDGKVSLQGRLLPSEKLEKTMDKYDLYGQSFNTELLHYFPEQSFAATSFSVNVLSLFDYLEETSKLEEFEENFKKEMGLEARDAFNALGGSMVLSLSDFETQEVEVSRYSYGGYEPHIREQVMPLISFAFDVKDRSTVKSMLEKIGEKDLKDRGDYYEFKMINYDVYLALNDGVCLVSNDLKSIKSFKDGGLSPNLGDSKLKNDLAASHYTYVSLDYDTYPEALKQELAKSGSNKMLEVVRTYGKSMHFRQVDEQTAEWLIELKQEDENSLRTILHAMDENYPYFL